MSYPGYSSIFTRNFSIGHLLQHISKSFVVFAQPRPKMLTKTYCKEVCLLWFYFTTVCNWLTKLAPLSPPMRNKAKTNPAFVALIFMRFASVRWICLEFGLVPCAVCVCRGLSEYLLCIWFCDTQSKTAFVNKVKQSTICHFSGLVFLCRFTVCFWTRCVTL